MIQQRPIAIITGAHGGMGRACARRLGLRCDLVLTDLDAGRLGGLSDALRDEGHTVAGVVAGDLSVPGVAIETVGLARSAGPLTVVAHTAGLSATMADWAAIVNANLIGTERLMTALEAALSPGLAAILIASLAGHRARANVEIDRHLAEPLSPHLWRDLLPLLEASCGSADALALSREAYHQTKRAIIRLCERRAPPWGVEGARILSISPGIVATPMGHREAGANPAAPAIIQATPVPRWGTVLDIANAVDFLSSDLASFVTGCDLRVDGGVIPALDGVTF